MFNDNISQNCHLYDQATGMKASEIKKHIEKIINESIPAYENNPPKEDVEQIDINLCAVEEHIRKSDHSDSLNKMYGTHLARMKECFAAINAVIEFRELILPAVESALYAAQEAGREVDDNTEINKETINNSLDSDNSSILVLYGMTDHGSWLMDSFQKIVHIQDPSLIEVFGELYRTSDALYRYFFSPTANEFALIQRFQDGFRKIEHFHEQVKKEDLPGKCNSFDLKNSPYYQIIAEGKSEA